jgi:geranylgeranyl pyrophosphate synthase
MGYGAGESHTVRKQTVFFFNLIFKVFQMLDDIFDFLGDSEN